MIATVLSWLGGLIGGPFAKAALDAYRAKLDAGNNADARTAELLSRELALEQRERELQAQVRLAQVGKWWTVENLCGYIVVAYIGKVIVWDKMLALGSTDAITGDVGTWVSLIIGFFFGSGVVKHAVTTIAGRVR